jgi:UDP-N-acetylglucosamine--N-acetylmuramyl-(pentapeptide) pyrophosphoryl-undecaprenol N-acetylglucosamine transferase
MSNKTYVLVGGGSGGHLTPIVAVAESLKSKQQGCIVIHVGQKGENLDDITDILSIDKAYSISAGKFRRYHGESLISQLMDFKTMILNIRDFFRFLVGTFQAYRLIGKTKPNSIFLKGGFVSVPMGYAARLRRVPYITHDSDVIPGLANRLTAKHAVYNTTAMPKELYKYKQSKTIQVGIPIRKEYKKVNSADKDKCKKELGYKTTDKVILSVGGGLGAQRVNHALVLASDSILSDKNDVKLIHLTGKKLFKETQTLYSEVLSSSKEQNLKLVDFTNSLYEFSAAADLVITRAGATNIAEFAAQAKPCIVVPNPILTGGQQIHNAKVLSDSNSAVILDESNLDNLANLVNELIVSPEKLKLLSENINKLAVYNSADIIADLLNEIAK